MSNLLRSDNFGQKIYDRFPPKYREDDVSQNYSLLRYLQSLSEGGFKHSIDEINGLTSLIDPNNVSADALPVLFRQYGLEVFNGIPENYLRYLLPRLGEAWSKKGSTSVVEFITSSLSGVKTTTEIDYDENVNPIIGVRLEMDYNIGDYFPDAEQFIRLLQNFVPFYSDVRLLYSYVFEEHEILDSSEKLSDKVAFISEEVASLPRKGYSHTGPKDTSVLGQAVLGISPFGLEPDRADSFTDNIIEGKPESAFLTSYPIDSFTNRLNNTLSGSFYTNALNSYDIIKIGTTSKIVY